jgi:hypoxanthine phosphoribosyltransferase
MRTINTLILSSKEALKFAEEIQDKLYEIKQIDSNGTRINEDKYYCRVWEEDIFEHGKNALENLLAIKGSGDYDYIIIILSPDDDLTCRGIEYKSPRDNVVFELGLCIGLFGMERTIIINHPDIKMPTDINGIMTFRIPEKKEYAARNIVKMIERHIDKSIERGLLDIVGWDEYSKLLNTFLKRINLTDHAGSSYVFDAILSASRSGTMAAELISRTFGFSMPVYYIVKGRGKDYGKYDSPDVVTRNMDTVNQFNQKGYTYVLLVDGLVDKKLRFTMHNAIDFLKEHCPKLVVKTGALIADEEFKNDKDNAVDYVAEYRKNPGNVTWFYKFF